MKRRGGFTLLEMLVVIIIIAILAGTSVMLMNSFFRGQGVRKGAMIVTQAVAEAKQMAAKTHRTVFLVFSPAKTEGWMEIHTDFNEDGIYQGDQKDTSVDPDPAIDRTKIELPKFVQFEKSPVWIGFTPSGYVIFNGGFVEMQASSFDAIMNGSNPTAVGDVVLMLQNRGFKMCLDLDRASGKIRRSFFLNQEG
jgi:prepilin-type N-terminal cleavage/methylation domain-containing protein